MVINFFSLPKGVDVKLKFYMKTNFLRITFLVVALVTVFSSCKKDEDDISDLYGTWVRVKIQENGVNHTFSISEENDKCTFHKNGTFYSHVSNVTGTWSYSNGILKLNYLCRFNDTQFQN